VHGYNNRNNSDNHICTMSWFLGSSLVMFSIPFKNLTVLLLLFVICKWHIFIIKTEVYKCIKIIVFLK